MRKLNTILSIILIFIFLIHGVMGSFMLLGIGSNAGKILAWIGIGILTVHVFIGFYLTIQTIHSSQQYPHYWKQNALFWARRISGLTLLILIFFHIGIFGTIKDGIYILYPFTTVKLITQILLIVALCTHIALNITPLLISYGITDYKQKREDIYLILSIIILFLSIAVIIYYKGWQTI